MVENLEHIILAQPLFSGLDAEIGALITGCARNHRFEAGTYLFHERDPADEFFLIREGEVSLEIDAPGRHTLVLNTIGEGQIVGVSWLVPPYRWISDARARSVVRALGFDAKCLRDKCDADPRTGYELMKRFVPLIANRLQSAYLQLLDVYRAPERR
jgi:CRP-like cAMP-binding protein